MDSYDLTKLGIFYTHNKIEKDLLRVVIDRLNQIIKEKNILIVASSYEPLEKFLGINLISKMRPPGSLSIALQILQCLIHAQTLNPNYKYVSLLEHDILYPLDYFDYQLFDENVVCNINYLLLSLKGFHKRKCSKSLSQLIMKFDFAINHFTQKIPDIFKKDSKLEPRIEIKNIISSPSLHFKHAHFTTSHYNTFRTDSYVIDEYLGDYNHIIADIKSLLLE